MLVCMFVLFHGLLQESLLSVPSLYQSGQRNTRFNARVLALWVASAIWHSLVCFYVPALALSARAAVSGSGQIIDIWATGTLAYTVVIVVVSSLHTPVTTATAHPICTHGRSGMCS